MKFRFCITSWRTVFFGVWTLLLVINPAFAEVNKRAQEQLIKKFKAGKVATDPTHWGKVTVNVLKKNQTSENKEDRAILTKVIGSYWERWIRQDSQACSSFVASDVLYVSGQTGVRASSQKELPKLLIKEWSAYERPAGVIAMTMNVRNVELDIRDNAARVSYWIEVEGGSRWGFDDLALVCQFYSKTNGIWKLAFHCDSWGLDYDIDSGVSGKPTFKFDYVYPVTDLKRAVAFYTPLLGTPEIVTSSHATYMLEDSRFHLDTSDLDGHVEIKKGLPSGYAIFYVDDIEEEKRRLEQAGVKVKSTTQTYTKDPLLVMEDTSKNIFGLTQRVYETDAKSAPVYHFDIAGSQTGKLAKALAEAWGNHDSLKFKALLNSDSTWFDDTRSKSKGVAKGSKSVMEHTEQDWKLFDHSAKGIAAEIKTNGYVEKVIGPWQLAIYRREMMGAGKQLYREKAWVCQCFSNEGKLQSSFVIRDNYTEAPVVELDYTGYPVTSLRGAETFYTSVLQLGKPYEDTAWRGYWSSNSVFGIYTSKFKRNGIPRPHKANGYVSFWVTSAEKIYEYLKKQKASFPKIPAINSKKGIDKQPGYTQILTLDSEGNAIIFSEYHGR